MGDPPGKKNGGSGCRKISRVIKKVISMKIIPGMIKGHDDHDNPAEEVDGNDSFGMGGSKLGQFAGY